MTHIYIVDYLFEFLFISEINNDFISLLPLVMLVVAMTHSNVAEKKPLSISLTCT